MVPLDPLAEESAPMADEQFLELLCTDPDWVRAEFDAIVAAEWPIPPSIGPRRGAAADQRPHPAAPVEPDSAAPAYREGVTTGPASALQRSPPAAPPHTVRSVTVRSVTEGW